MTNPTMQSQYFNVFFLLVFINCIHMCYLIFGFLDIKSFPCSTIAVSLLMPMVIGV